MIRHILQLANRYSGQLFAVGLTGIVCYNWRLWQRDKAQADRLRAGRVQTPQLSQTPKVSALVAAWNESAHIDEHIQSFLALGYPNIELILCAGGNDNTLQRARHYASERIVVLEQRPGEGKQRSLARCLEHASGDIIYLTDADCRFDDEALVRLISPLINEQEQAVTGGSRPLQQQTGHLLPTYLWSVDAAANMRQPIYVTGMLGRNAAVTHVALDRIGGMDFAARTGTDYQLAQRLLQQNINIRYVAESVIQSEYPETIASYRHKQSRWLRNLLMYGPRYGARNDVVATMRTVGIGVAMLTAPLAGLVAGRIVFVAWLLAVLHSVCSKLRYTQCTARLYDHKSPYRLLAILFPMTIVDFVIWVLPAFDLLNPRRRVKW